MPSFVECKSGVWVNTEAIRHIENGKSSQTLTLKGKGPEGKATFQTVGKQCIDCMQTFPEPEDGRLYLDCVDLDGVRQIPLSRILLYQEGRPLRVVDSKDGKDYVVIGESGHLEDCTLEL